MSIFAERTGRRGIRLSLVIFAVVLFSVAATFSLSTLVGYETQRQSLRENTLVLNRITANELSRTTETIVTSMQDALKTAAESLSSSLGSPSAIQSKIDFMRSTVPYFNSILLADDSGVVVTTSPEALQVKGTKLTSDQSRQALAERKPIISTPYIAVTGRMIVLASYPVYRSDGTYFGFIAGTIYLQESNVFQKVLGQQEANENGSYYYVVDSSGDLIFHPYKKRIGQNVASNPVVAALMKGENGGMPVTNTLGERFLAGYSVVPSVGWGIVSQTPAASVEKRVGDNISRMIAVSLPLMLVLLLLVIFVANRLSAPLNRLASLAAKLQTGEAETVSIPETRHWNYEANELYKAVSQAFRMLSRRAEEFSNQANTDQLTGLTNRRRMDAVVDEWIGGGRPFSVIMLDLDRFKSVNDTYGHAKGDEVLKFLAGLMRDETGDEGYCCRYGGEEFSILLPQMAEETAYKLAERIRRRIERASSPIGQPVTLSLGISSFPGRADDASALFRQADRALYQAKESGRNRTVVYREAAAGVESV